MRKEQYAGLSAYVTGGSDGLGGGTGPVVILLHGFGAPGFDLVDLGSMFNVPAEVRFVFPEAPLALDPGYGGGRAWWMLDLALFEARARGVVIDRSNDMPEALPAVSNQVQQLVHEVEASLSVGRRQLVLGGFSQGSMVACDVALSLAEKPAALILLSSTLMAKQRWTELAKSVKGLPILQSHGTQDPILPYQDAERLAELLRNAEADLTWLGFPGGHQIPGPVLQAASKLVRNATGSGSA